MDFAEKQLCPGFSLLSRLMYESSFFHSAKFSHQSWSEKCPLSVDL